MLNQQVTVQLTFCKANFFLVTNLKQMTSRHQEKKGNRIKKLQVASQFCYVLLCFKFNELSPLLCFPFFFFDSLSSLDPELSTVSIILVVSILLLILLLRDFGLGLGVRVGKSSSVNDAIIFFKSGGVPVRIACICNFFSLDFRVSSVFLAFATNIPKK